LVGRSEPDHALHSVAGAAVVQPPIPDGMPDVDAATAVNAASKLCVKEGYHIMLSYQWDHQQEVVRVKAILDAAGFNTWMDISGGMGTDIYDSMAAGVANAAAVVCFMYGARFPAELYTRGVPLSFTPLLRLKRASAAMRSHGKLCRNAEGRLRPAHCTNHQLCHRTDHVITLKVALVSRVAELQIRAQVCATMWYGTSLFLQPTMYSISSTTSGKEEGLIMAVLHQCDAVRGFRSDLFSPVTATAPPQITNRPQH
jgi:putative hemolysin